MAPEPLAGLHQRHRQWRTTNLGKCRLGPAVWDARRTHRPGRYAGPGDGLPRRACRAVWLCRRRPPEDGRARHRTHPDPAAATDRVVHRGDTASVASPGRHVWRLGATHRPDRLPARPAERLRLAAVSRGWHWPDHGRVARRARGTRWHASGRRVSWYYLTRAREWGSLKLTPTAGAGTACVPRPSCHL